MSTGDSQPKKPVKLLATVSGALSGVVGYYCGLMMLIPLAAGAVAWLVARRFASAPLKPFLGALAIIFGYLSWLCIGALVAHMVVPIIADLILVIAGLIWLVSRPGLGPVILLGLYEGVSLMVNIVNIIPLHLGATDHQALTTNIALRLFALGALIAGYREFRKQQSGRNLEIPPGAA